MKWTSGIDMTGNPLLLLGVMLSLMSLQVLSVGLIGESTTRLYYNRNGRRPFTVREILGRTEQDDVIFPLPQNTAKRQVA
jgi:hypothetical protein